MGTTIKILGAIDRSERDPSAPSDPLASWIGNLAVSWVGEDGPIERHAALAKACTGRGIGDAAWGQHVLVLRWIGDPPPAEIAQAVYDVVRDGGPDRRVIARTVVSQPRTEAQHSYRAPSRTSVARA